MTGYGEAACERKGVKILLQVRSLNHRSLDVQVRVPREYLALEEAIRQKIRERIRRGRVEVFLSRSTTKGSQRAIELDEELAGQFVRALREAQRRFHLKGELSLALLGSRPELFRLRELEVDGRGEAPLVLKAVGTALRNLEQSRRREGRNLRRDMESQIRELARVCARLEREAKFISERLKEAWLQSPETGASPERATAAEGALKGDIHEEVVRLRSHVAELTRTLRSQEPAGKRIEFLLQEAQRELNTIGAKAPQLAVSRLVVDGKERVEKVREQAQNVE
ncbi:MAG TPA: YicC/YloC family endoribonuclease [Candidatus Acidoferrales bacterium]|nr:YicC/YloC family endoribonuclease [Candidatus Acidoferrales bacterium]